MIAVLLSFNVILPLVPVIIIAILIMAAAGLTRGMDMFALLGIGSLMGLGGKAGGGNAGKGLGKVKYAGNAIARGRAVGKAGKMIGAMGLGKNGLRKALKLKKMQKAQAAANSIRPGGARYELAKKLRSDASKAGKESGAGILSTAKAGGIRGRITASKKVRMSVNGPVKTAGWRLSTEPGSKGRLVYTGVNKKGEVVNREFATLGAGAAVLAAAKLKRTVSGLRSKGGSQPPLRSPGSEPAAGPTQGKGAQGSGTALLSRRQEKGLTKRAESEEKRIAAEYDKMFKELRQKGEISDAQWSKYKAALQKEAKGADAQGYQKGHYSSGAKGGLEDARRQTLSANDLQKEGKVSQAKKREEDLKKTAKKDMMERYPYLYDNKGNPKTAKELWQDKKELGKVPVGPEDWKELKQALYDSTFWGQQAARRRVKARKPPPSEPSAEGGTGSKGSK